MSDNLKQVEMAKETLRVFLERGEDMHDIRHVVHYFYGGNPNGLGLALSELGYAIRPTVNDDGVIAERHESIGEEWRTTTLVHLCEVADIYGADYDGWEASMERQPKSETSQEQKAGWMSKLFKKKK
jgi:hypothetical protein